MEGKSDNAQVSQQERVLESGPSNLSTASAEMDKITEDSGSLTTKKSV